MRLLAAMLCKAGVLGLLISWLLSVWVQLSRLPVLEWVAAGMGVDGRTGDGDDEMDSVLRESALNSGPNNTPVTNNITRHQTCIKQENKSQVRPIRDVVYVV